MRVMFLIDGSGMCPHNSRRYNEFRKLKGHLAIIYNWRSVAG